MPQLTLFEETSVSRPPARPRRNSAPDQTRGPLSHRQFEYDRCRAVFGNRDGWGPLLVMPDTNVLIDLVDAHDTVESHFAIAGPIPRGDRELPPEALRELFALWFHRDIRWVVSDVYVLDSRRKPLAPARIAARRRVLAALGQDLEDRGGTRRCALSSDPAADGLHPEAAAEWESDDDRDLDRARAIAPRARTMFDGADGELIADALICGAHVFLTEDREILRAWRRLFCWGLSVLRPVELLDALDDAGELGEQGVGGPGYELVPDLLSLSRFYALVENETV